jgi:hypothetical protein
MVIGAGVLLLAVYANRRPNPQKPGHAETVMTPENDDGSTKPINPHVQSDPNPLVQDLLGKRFRSGTPVEEFIAAYPPFRSISFGEYQVFNFEPVTAMAGITVIARNGKLVCAYLWGCIVHHTFFSSFGGRGAVERIEFSQDYDAAVRNRNRSILFCQMATGGTALQAGRLVSASFWPLPDEP